MARKAGPEERIHLHSLSHTTGASLAMKDVLMCLVQIIFANLSANVTERYSHLAPEALSAGMEKVSGK